MMKISKIIYVLGFLSIFVSLPTFSADSSGGVLEQSDGTITHYGLVDGIYPIDSRIILDDTNIYYTLSSRFYDRSGMPIANIRQSLKIGTPVIFRYYKKSSTLVLQELKIIPKKELDASGY